MLLVSSPSNNEFIAWSDVVLHDGLSEYLLEDIPRLIWAMTMKSNGSIDSVKSFYQVNQIEPLEKKCKVKSSSKLVLTTGCFIIYLKEGRCSKLPLWLGFS